MSIFDKAVILLQIYLCVFLLCIVIIAKLYFLLPVVVFIIWIAYSTAKEWIELKNKRRF